MKNYGKVVVSAVEYDVIGNAGTPTWVLFTGCAKFGEFLAHNKKIPLHKAIFVNRFTVLFRRRKF